MGGWEILLILAVFILLFGARKLPELARGLGQGVKEFKKATRNDVQDGRSWRRSADRRVSNPPPSKLAQAGTCD